MERRTFKGFAYVLFAVIVWSGWMVASRFAIKGTLTSYDITALRFTVGGVAFLPVVLRKGLRIGPKGLWSGFLLSVLMGAPYTNIAVAGMAFAPASHASTIINGTVLVITTLAGIFILRESTSPLRLFGVACSIAGIIFMLAGKSDAGGANQGFGHLLFIISGILWASYILLIRAWKVGGLHAASVVCVFSMLIYMPFYLLFADSHIGMHNWHEVAFQGIYQGILTAVIALSAFNIGVGILGASRAGAIIPLVPVLSTLLAIPVLGEIPSLFEWVAVGTVSLGVLLASGVLSWRPLSREKVL